MVKSRKETCGIYNVKSISYPPGTVQWPCTQEAQPWLCSHIWLNLYPENQTGYIWKRREKCEIISLLTRLTTRYWLSQSVFSLCIWNNFQDQRIPLLNLEEYIRHYQLLMYNNQQFRPHHHPTNQEREHETSSGKFLLARQLFVRNHLLRISLSNSQNTSSKIYLLISSSKRQFINEIGSHSNLPLCNILRGKILGVSCSNTFYVVLQSEQNLLLIKEKQ